jgi:hypothetical protein
MIKGYITSDVMNLLFQNPPGTAKGDALRDQLLRQELYGIRHA